MAKHLVVRKCGHSEKVKVYERAADSRKFSRIRVERVLAGEKYKLCRECSKEKMQ